MAPLTALPSPAVARCSAGARVTPPARAAVLSPVVPVNRVVRWALYVMVFSLPFEMPNRTTIPFEIPTITAALFLLTTVFQPRVCFGRIPPVVFWFIGYLYACGVAISVNGWINVVTFTNFFLLITQGILIFWVASNLLRDERIARAVLWWFIIACLIRATLPLIGIGRTATLVWTGGERVTAFGQNPNISAVLLSAGVVALVGLTYAQGALRPTVLAWPLMAVLGLAVIETGSRGGLLALGVGLVAFMSGGGRRLWPKVRNALVVLVAIGLLVAASYRSPLIRNRFEATAQSGNMAGRELIYPAAWHMFLEKPMVGWGPMNNQYEVAIRIGERIKPKRDTHNLILELLTSTGILGAVPFLVGLGLCVRAAWRARYGARGTVPLALAGVVFMGNMSGNRIDFKLFWLTLAYALASEHLCALHPDVFRPGRRYRGARAGKGWLPHEVTAAANGPPEETR